MTEWNMTIQLCLLMRNVWHVWYLYIWLNCLLGEIRFKIWPASRQWCLLISFEYVDHIFTMCSSAYKAYPRNVDIFEFRMFIAILNVESLKISTHNINNLDCTCCLLRNIMSSGKHPGSTWDWEQHLESDSDTSIIHPHRINTNSTAIHHAVVFSKMFSTLRSTAISDKIKNLIYWLVIAYFSVSTIMLAAKLVAVGVEGSAAMLASAMGTAGHLASHVFVICSAQASKAEVSYLTFTHKTYVLLD